MEAIMFNLYENGKIWMIRVHFLAKNNIGLCMAILEGLLGEQR
jgi:hypothetical protein